MLGKIFQTVTKHQRIVSRTFAVVRLVHETYQAFCTSLAKIMAEDEPEPSRVPMVLTSAD